MRSGLTMCRCDFVVKCVHAFVLNWLTQSNRGGQDLSVVCVFVLFVLWNVTLSSREEAGETSASAPSAHRELWENKSEASAALHHYIDSVDNIKSGCVWRPLKMLSYLEESDNEMSWKCSCVLDEFLWWVWWVSAWFSRVLQFQGYEDEWRSLHSLLKDDYVTAVDQRQSCSNSQFLNITLPDKERFPRGEWCFSDVSLS